MNIKKANSCPASIIMVEAKAAERPRALSAVLPELAVRPKSYATANRLVNNSKTRPCGGFFFKRVAREANMQCKDIPEQPILKFLHSLNGRWACWYSSDDGTPFENSVANAFPPGTPAKLIVAKMGMMIRKGVVDGCSCGCRGDYRLTDKGVSRI